MAKEEYEIEDLGEVELDPETDAKVTRMIAEADKEIEETRVSFRWGKEQLAIVRQAAENMGVPYQTFIKMCVFQHALDVLKDVQAAKPKGKDAA
jgi:predicted DNA binding CopG/RHH family protein